VGRVIVAWTCSMGMDALTRGELLVELRQSDVTAAVAAGTASRIVAEPSLSTLATGITVDKNGFSANKGSLTYANDGFAFNRRLEAVSATSFKDTMEYRAESQPIKQRRSMPPSLPSTSTPTAEHQQHQLQAIMLLLVLVQKLHP
jgi:hypothetical protein